MERRKFVETALVASTVPITALSAKASLSGTLEEPKEDTKMLIEIRTYEIKFRGNRDLLISYLWKALQPALERREVRDFMLYTELGDEEPTKIWLVIGYPNAEIYMKCQDLWDDEEYMEAAAEYHKSEQSIYNRYSSWLLSAFEGMPSIKRMEDANLLELRTYEGYNEDAVRRKIKMFNDEEIELFNKVGFNPVFFGKMISGPYRPSLVYMLGFPDREKRNETWKEFLAHPEWKRMLGEEKYANTVSNIRKVFLKPMKF